MEPGCLRHPGSSRIAMTSILVVSPDRPLVHKLTRLLNARHHTVEVAGLHAVDAPQACEVTSAVAVVDLRAAPTTTLAAILVCCRDRSRAADDGTGGVRGHA